MSEPTTENTTPATDARAQYGKPKYGKNSDFKYKKVWRLKGVEKAASPELYRVIPPMKSGAATGRWAEFKAVHFGYRVENTSKPGNFILKPFLCPRVKNRDGMITTDCAECRAIEAMEDRMKRLEAELTSQGMPEEEIKAELEPMTLWLKDHNRDSKYYINVKSAQGEFGALAIPGKMKMALDDLIKELQTDDGVDALDIEQGVMVNFKREGKGGAMTFKATAEKEVEIIKGKRVTSPKLAPLTDDDLAKALEECFDLKNEPIGFIVITQEQITALTECSGAPEEVAAILKAGATNAPAAQEATTPAKAEKKAEPAKAATTKVAPKTAVKAAEKAPDTDSENLTDEEFAAKYGK